MPILPRNFREPLWVFFIHQHLSPCWYLAINLIEYGSCKIRVCLRVFWHYSSSSTLVLIQCRGPSYLKIENLRETNGRVSNIFGWSLLFLTGARIISWMQFGRCFIYQDKSFIILHGRLWWCQVQTVSKTMLGVI